MVKKYSCLIIYLIILEKILFPNFIFSQWILTSTPPSSSGSLVSSGDKIIASTGGIYYSANLGNNWILTNLSGVIAPALTSIGSKVFAGNSNGLFYSSNNGINWSTTPVNTYPINYLRSNDSVLFAGTYTGVYRSINNGLNWNSTSVNYSVYALGVLGNRVLASVIDNVLYTALIFRSSDGGVSWSNFYSGLPDAVVNNFGFNSNTCFAGFNSGQYGIYKSTDYGDHWISCNLNKNVYCIMTLNNNIFVGTSSGVSLSTNNGVNWSDINQGFSAVTGVNSLLIYNNYIFASMSSGVWKRALSEVISNINSQNNNIPDKYSLYQNYPNPFNPSTKIKFDICAKSGREFVTVKIYNMLGGEIATLVSEELNSGTYESTWNAEAFSSGIYFVKIKAGDYINTKRMVLMK